MGVGSCVASEKFGIGLPEFIQSFRNDSSSAKEMGGCDVCRKAGTNILLWELCSSITENVSI